MNHHWRTALCLIALWGLSVPGFVHSLDFRSVTIASSSTPEADAVSQEPAATKPPTMAPPAKQPHLRPEASKTKKHASPATRRQLPDAAHPTGSQISQGPEKQRTVGAKPPKKRRNQANTRRRGASQTDLDDLTPPDVTFPGAD